MSRKVEAEIQEGEGEEEEEAAAAAAAAAAEEEAAEEEEAEEEDAEERYLPLPSSSRLFPSSSLRLVFLHFRAIGVFAPTDSSLFFSIQ